MDGVTSTVSHEYFIMQLCQINTSRRTRLTVKLWAYHAGQTYKMFSNTVAKLRMLAGNNTTRQHFGATEVALQLHACDGCRLVAGMED
jgi:hypothetical protein